VFFLQSPWSPNEAPLQPFIFDNFNIHSYWLCAGACHVSPVFYVLKKYCHGVLREGKSERACGRPLNGSVGNVIAVTDN